jgi:uncharacterized protein YndB with AHSA1/START domain
MARYRFLSTWILDAPIADVWDAIYAVERWPEWWLGVRSVVELVHGGGDGVGTRHAHVWRARLPYDLRFELEVTRVERPFLLEGRASGDLAGTGRWRLFEGAATAVTYEWDVAATIGWMNALAPLARPVFAANHDWVMRRGGEGLAGRLGARLLACD